MSLPETEELPHFDMASFRIRGKIFATVPGAGDRLHVFVDASETKATVTEDPAVYSELRWGKRLSGLRVELPSANVSRVRELLTDAWRRKAPRGVVADYDVERNM